MPRKKASIMTTSDIKNQNSLSEVFEKVHLSESYGSLILGIVVVLLISTFTLSYLKSRRHTSVQSAQVKKVQEKKQPEHPTQTYTIIEGDQLKAISRKFYGTEDLYMDIAKANNISDVDRIEVGTKLTIPYVDGKSFTVLASQKNQIYGDTYTVGQKELLWDIAIRAYGSGFKWADIAKVNNLSGPEAINEGMVLKLPR